MTGRRLVQSLLTAVLLLIVGILCLLNARLAPWAVAGAASAIAGFYILESAAIPGRFERLVIVVTLASGVLTVTSVVDERVVPFGGIFPRIRQTISYLVSPSVTERIRPTFATYSGRARLVDDEWIISETMTLGREAAGVAESSVAVTRQLTRDLAQWEWVPDPAHETGLAFRREREVAADFGRLFPPRTTNVLELGIPIIRDDLGRVGTFRLTESSRLSIVAEKYAVTETFPPSSEVDLLREGLGRFDVPVQDTREVRLNVVSTSLRDPIPNALVTFSLNEWAKAVAVAAATGGAVMIAKALRARPEGRSGASEVADAVPRSRGDQGEPRPRPSAQPRGAEKQDAAPVTATEQRAVGDPPD